MEMEKWWDVLCGRISYICHSHCQQKSELLCELGSERRKGSNLHITEQNLRVVVDVITVKVFRDSQQQKHFRNREEISKLYHFSRLYLMVVREREREEIPISLVENWRNFVSSSAIFFYAANLPLVKLTTQSSLCELFTHRSTFTFNLSYRNEAIVAIQFENFIVGYWRDSTEDRSELDL